MKLLPSRRRAWFAAAIVLVTISFATLGAQPQSGPFAALYAAVAALQSQVASLSAAVAALQNQSGGGVREVWRVGIPYGGNGFFGSNIFFCTNFCPPNVVNSFDVMTPQPRRVEAVNMIVSNRSGAYGMGMMLTLEIRSFDSSSSRTITTAPINIEVAPQLQWIEVPIVATPDAVVQAGEYLASRVQLGGPQGGNLNLNLHLRADVVEP